MSDQDKAIERLVALAVVWLFVILLTAGLAWLACWGFCVEFRARYLAGVFAAGFIVKMWMTPISRGDRK